MRISRADNPIPSPERDDRQGTIMDDAELGDDEEDSDFDPDTYDSSSSESDDTYYDSSSSSDDDDSNSETDLEDLDGDLDSEKIHTGKTKGTRTDGDLSLGANISYENYPGVPQKAVTGPVVAAVFCTSALFILAGVIYLNNP